MADSPLPPGSTIGILGGGQLGRMLALAAAKLGLDVVILTPDEDSPASRVVKKTIVATYDDPKALKALSRLVDVVTYEFENVPAAAVEQLAALNVTVSPDPRALAVAQDRVDEKTFLNTAGAPTVAFAAIDSAEALAIALAEIGAPALLKTRRGGYDGKGQTWVENAADAPAAFARLDGAPAILEARAEFVRELSVIAARGRDGEIALFPLAENHHENGVLRRTSAPAPVGSATLEQAERIAAQVMAALDYVGVIGIELFQLTDGRLVVNEIAPRVHNTGHWTQDGCVTDQFEQHIRAVAGWPLGSTAATGHVEMTNLLGEEAADWPRLAADPEARLHLYGKREMVAGRKMGHVNRVRPLERG
ncbi:5-(carboxyamino)imidazole ribonucleotide synthase [Caulobacter ginsengisoli]|uniref:N5-carboxyaminoimidazole ribonucleotide synthase n=1 Tax=Caulobacter ginsengisoli TaxID=400775 RepID=A0ABU0ISW0_9CAUL|nr:5-(carboxyamino)imidazole ribonucleotide synthase [Caulobacter ginsengisoli]MDQ0465081.1 5-(carboxyamino)imidazole ribonucleotide synthase [Caulobacter ginsengisoli]